MLVETVSDGVRVHVEFRETPSHYECRIWITPEADGGFSTEVVSLPGVASQGETEGEAVENLKEAFRGAVESYQDAGQEIPWSTDIGTPPPDVKERWILVDV